MIPLISLLGTIGGSSGADGAIGAAVQEELQKEFGRISKEGAIEGAKAMQKCIRRHFQQRFPGSKHYSPSRVRRAFNYVQVDVPGVTRAYQDIDIYPKNAAWLCIPVDPRAKGKSPRAFDGLFKPKNHNVLAKSENRKLVVYYALSKHVHQKKDSSIMPSDETLAAAAVNAMGGLLDR